MIRHEGDKWCLYTRDGSKLIACHDTKEGAEAQERAIYANKPSSSKKSWLSIEDVEKFCRSCATELRKRGVTRVSPELVLAAIAKAAPGVWEKLTKGGPGNIDAIIRWFSDVGWEECVSALEGHPEAIDDPERLCGWLKAQAREMGLPVHASVADNADAKAKADRKSTVCIDLDGVLAKYDGFRGYDVIGDPLPGAREFMADLKKRYRVIVFTTRASAGDKGLNPVKAWLEDNQILHDEIWTRAGKPLAIAYVDDRAVPVPENPEADAYPGVIAKVDALRDRATARDNAHEK